MRRFRVWDVKNKRMNNGGFWVGALGGVVGLVTHIANVGEVTIQLQAPKDFILIESTGLKDENGNSKDWWKDDILQPIDGSDRIGIIAYNEQFAEYELQNEYDKRICSLGAACCDGWQKVGNVHENPELLGPPNEPSNHEIYRR